MGKVTRVPSQAASGRDTFNDSLVGFQIVDGSSQLMNTSFMLDKVIPEKDAKEFIGQPFSDFMTLDDINEERTTIIDDSITTKQKDVKFNSSKIDGGKSLFGALKDRLNVSVVDIIKRFPAAIYIDANSPIIVEPYSAESIVYDSISNITTFKIQTSMMYNPLDVVIKTKKGTTLTESEKDIRNFYSSYTKYVVDINNNLHDIIDYTEPDSTNKVTIRTNGNCFSGSTGYTESYFIRPNNGIVEEFYNGLDDLQTILLNRETIPIYQASFKVPKDDGGNQTVVINWPMSRDGWNIQVVGINYEKYITDLKSIGDELDNYKSNLVIRFLTSPQLYEFDTIDKKMEMGFQIYGQSFDKVKKYIDNIAFMRNVSYNKINNVPDLLLKNLSETLGFSAVNLLDSQALDKNLYERHDTQYDGVALGSNLIEAEYEFYRRLLVNLAYLYKSKGTRESIEFFLKFIGAPEPMIVFNEYLYEVTGGLPSTYEDDIADLLLGVKYNYQAEYNEVTSGYTLMVTTGSTNLTRDEYPVDTDGNPRGLLSADGTYFFENGAGWYRSTIDHRGPDILDVNNSILTGNTKVIKTTGKPFTYGEDYFNAYRMLPGLDYGYELSKIADNRKIMNVSSIEQQKRILNRKNVSIFISADRAIDYDIYTKGRDLDLSFGTLEPQTGKTFVQFLNDVLSENITDSNLIRFKKEYTSLKDIYANYMESIGFTPYNFIKLNDFINKISPYWTSIIDQFIPATTQWLGGNLISNNIFNRCKYQYIKPCSPIIFTTNLYPDFESVIKEELETILGGGTINGQNMSFENFRGLLSFEDMTFTIHLLINGNLHSVATPILKNEIFSGFTATSNCTSLVSTTDSIPLICDFKNWINVLTNELKVIWKATLESLILSLNNYNLKVEFFTDIDDIEKVKFSANDAYSSSDCIDTLLYYYNPQYTISKTDCNLRVEVFSYNDIFYPASILNTCIQEDVFVAMINYGTGFITGNEQQPGTPINFFITSGSTCDTGNTCSYCNLSEVTNIPPISSTQLGCVYGFPQMKETDVIEMIISDSANCEQKIRIEGLNTICYKINGVSFYKIYPNVQYKTSFDYGLKKGTIAYKKATPGQSIVINTWEELESYISDGDIVEVLIENIEIGDSLLSITPKNPATVSSLLYKDILTTGAKFSFNYSFVAVEKIECLSSIKKNIINNEFEVLPTTKLYTYTATNEFLERVQYHFRYKVAEDLIIKSTEPVSCCEEQQLCDYLVDQDGFLIEVTGTSLNYCDKGIYYQIHASADGINSILFNGGAGKKIITSHKVQPFECLNMKLEAQYNQMACSERDVCAENLCGDGGTLGVNTLFMHIPNNDLS